jgi:hypothetical protein
MKTERIEKIKAITGDLEINHFVEVEEKEIEVTTTYENVTFSQAQQIIENFEAVKSFSWR